MAEDLRWTFCPECGCEAFRQGEKTERECQRCRQSYFTDADYTDACRRNIVRLMANGEKENATLRSEVERLNKVSEAWRKESIRLEGVSGEYLADLNYALARERRYVEALEKIPKLMEVFKDVEDMELRHYRSAWLRAYSIAKEALSPAPVTETVYGPTGVCPEHGVMKERCKCSQEAGGKTIPQLMSEQYDKENAKSGDRIPDAGEKVEGQLEDDLDLVLGRLRGKHLWIDRAENHRVLEGLVSHVREKALKEAAEIAKPGASHIYNGILSLLKKDEGRAGI